MCPPMAQRKSEVQWKEDKGKERDSPWLLVKNSDMVTKDKVRGRVCFMWKNKNNPEIKLENTSS